MPKKKRKNEDTELIAVITAAIAAACAEETSVPVVTAVREREAPETVITAARDVEIPEAGREEETQDSADSFVARTIKRRDNRKNGRSPRI